MSLVVKEDLNLKGFIILLDTVIENAYDIEQTFNIISIIPHSTKYRSSKYNRSRALNRLKQVGYGGIEINITSTSIAFNVFEAFSSVKFKFWQFMNKCYNIENI